jgi:hypothetical protein
VRNLARKPKDAPIQESEKKVEKRGRKKKLVDHADVPPAPPTPPTHPKEIILFESVNPENCFVLCDGRIIKDYLELARILETLNDDVFCYHVTNEKNDFANWINDIFKEEELATDLRLVKSRAEMIALLYENLFDRLLRLVHESKS